MHWAFRAMMALAAAGLTLIVFGTCAVGPFLPARPGDWWNETTMVAVGLVLSHLCCVAAYDHVTRAHGPSLHDSEVRCRKCRYILKGISEPRCPECGERI